MKTLNKGQYYGIKNTEKSFGGILLSQYSYQGDRTDWHYHENPYFMYVLQGNMKDTNANKETLCPAGSLMFTNWQEAHYGSMHSEKAGGFHIELDRGWLKINEIDTTILEGSKLIEHPKVHFLLAKLYYEFLLQDKYSGISVELLLLQICDTISALKKVKTEQKQPKWVKQLVELVHSNESELSLSYLSEQLNVHPTHISRAIPKYLSTNLGEYIRQQKLRKSIPLLLDSRNSLTSIAYHAGFADQSHFNKVFKSVFHMNPSAYRKSLNKS